jgi:hypothetical protein
MQGEASNGLTSDYAIYTQDIDSGPACTYSVEPPSLTFPASGASLSLSVTTQAGCAWTPVPSGSWFHLFQTPGSNTVVVATTPNFTNVPFTGSIVIGTQTIPVTVLANDPTRPPSCATGVTPTSVTFAGGEPKTITVAAPPGCAWGVTNTHGWLGAHPQSGSGNGTVQLVVGPNPGSPRSPQITVAGTTVNVSQLTTCIDALSPSLVSIPATGGKGELTTPRQPHCTAWKASSSDSWIQVYPESSTASTLTYTVFPNFSPFARSGQVFLGSSSTVIRQTGAAGTSDARFVGQMYFNFLGRLASPSEVAFHVGTLGQGVSRAELVMNFFGTPEFNNGGRFIAGLYVGLLDRDAEYSGWLFQRNALATGAVQQVQLATNFLNAPEWALKFGSPNNPEFVRLLYKYVLLREASQAEVDLQVNAVAAGIVNRTTLANAFLNSEEFRNGTGPRLTAFLLYATLLHRHPATNEFSTAVHELQTGSTVKSLAQKILASSEFTGLLN